MNFLETPHKKKSAIVTFFIGVLIILFFYFIGMKYYDPPIVYGMEVSFGNTTENFGEEISKSKNQIEKNNSNQESKKVLINSNKENKILREKKSIIKTPIKNVRMADFFL